MSDAEEPKEVSFSNVWRLYWVKIEVSSYVEVPCLKEILRANLGR